MFQTEVTGGKVSTVPSVSLIVNLFHFKAII